MAANGGYRVFNTGDVLTAAQVQYYLQNQTVMYFATTTARDAVLTGATLVEGMLSYTPATGVMVYNGTAWKTLAQSPLTTKGDIWTYSTTNDRIPVGTDGQVLTAASGQSTGLQWTTPTSGSLTLLSTTNLSGTSTVVSSISQSYTNLFVVIQNCYVNAAAKLLIKANSTAGLVAANGIFGTGSIANYGEIQTGGTTNISTTSQPTQIAINLQISNYTDTTYAKPFLFYGSVNNTIGSIGIEYGVIGTASAISSLQITTEAGTSTFSGGRVLVYGVK